MLRVGEKGFVLPDWLALVVEDDPAGLPCEFENSFIKSQMSSDDVA
jgi:hypothetical protein